MAYESECRSAVDAVLKACRLCSAVRSSMDSGDKLDKSDRSPVTVADFGSQAIITHFLRRDLPEIPLVAEEDASALRGDDHADVRQRVLRQVSEIVAGLQEDEVLDSIDSGRHQGGAGGRIWSLDPIDGTKGFLRNDQYAIALGLIENGRPVLGVLGCPNLPVDALHPEGDRGCLFLAVSGEGTLMRTLDDPATRLVQVTRIDHPAEATFCESVESGHSKHSDSATVAERLGVTKPPFRIDSQCKYAAIARGDSSIYLRLPTRADYEERIWDHAAGWMVVTEAGGRVSDVTGKPLDFSLGRTLRGNKGVVATNGLLHDRVIAAVRQVLGIG